MNNIVKHFNWFILLVLVLHIVLKLAFISQETLYTDEPYSLSIAQQSFQEIYAQSLQDSNPPLYLFLLHIWVTLFGVSAMAAKLFSVLASVATGLMIALFAKKFCNIPTAIFASILYLGSNVQLYYSHEIRTYAVLGFFIMLSMYVFFSLLRSPNKRFLILLALINVALLLFHYTSIYVHIAQGIIALLHFRTHTKAFWYYCISQIISCILFFPWILTVFQNAPSNAGWIKSPNWGDFVNILIVLSNSKAAVVVFALLCLGVLYVAIQKPHMLNSSWNIKQFLSLAIWFVVPIVLNYIVSQISPQFLIRTLLFANLGLCILVGYAFSVLKVGKYIQYTVAGVVGISYFYSFSVYQPRPEQWNKVVPPLTQKSESTAVFVSPWYTYRAFAYYYNIDYFKNHTRTLELLSAEHVHFLDNPQTLDSIQIVQFDTIHIITCRGPMEQFDSVLTSFRYKQLHHSQYWDMKNAIYVRSHQ